MEVIGEERSFECGTHKNNAEIGSARDYVFKETKNEICVDSSGEKEGRKGREEGSGERRRRRKEERRRGRKKGDS